MVSNRSGINRDDEYAHPISASNSVQRPFEYTRPSTSIISHQRQSAELKQQRCGIIILGNSGVGKSFIANLCAQAEVFEHKYATITVTKAMEYIEYEVGKTTYLIFNVPGLIETSQLQIDVNEQEIDKAFQICPNAVVFYVLGNKNGSIPNEDVIAFNALHDAYAFRSQSLVLVVNGVPNKLDPDYEGKTIALLKQTLHMNEFDNVCFLPLIDQRFDKAKEMLRQKLMQTALMSQPANHYKERDIELDMDRIRTLTETMCDIQSTFEREKKQFASQIQAEQVKYQQEMQRQKENFENLLEKYQENETRDRREMLTRLKRQRKQFVQAQNRQADSGTLAFQHNNAWNFVSLTAAETDLHPLAGLAVADADFLSIIYH